MNSPRSEPEDYNKPAEAIEDPSLRLKHRHLCRNCSLTSRNPGNGDVKIKTMMKWDRQEQFWCLFALSNDDQFEETKSLSADAGSSRPANVASRRYDERFCAVHRLAIGVLGLNDESTEVHME